MSRTDLRRRVAALNEAINPAGSLTAKLAKLTKEQQDEYRRWQDRSDRFYAANPGGSAYARIINGEQSPPLRRDVRHALFGPTPVITADMTDRDAADAYAKLVTGN